MEVARWFGDELYPAAAGGGHRHAGGAPFFPHQPPPPRRQDAPGGATSDLRLPFHQHRWPATVVDAAAVPAPWSSLQLAGAAAAASPPWTAAPAAAAGVHAGRPGCLDDWPRASGHVTSPAAAHHHHHHHDNCHHGNHHHHQQQQQQHRSPDDVGASFTPTHKYPWMSVIGQFD